MRPELSAQRTHRRWVAVVPWLLALLAPQPSASIQIALLALGVAFLGLPHGALDHRVARPLLANRWGSGWLPLFLVAYLAVAALVLAAWWWIPALTLVGFLLLSIVHFGADAAGDTGGSLHSMALHGGLPVVFPCAFHSQEVAALFGALVPGARWAEEVARIGWIGAVLWCLLFAVAALRREQPLGDLWMLAGLALMFWRLPPLLAFAVYFCGVHSIHHLLEVVREEAPAGEEGLNWLLREALPLTTLTLLLVVSVAPAVSADSTLTEGTVRMIFWVLAALTVPHMGLLWVWNRARRQGLADSVRTDRKASFSGSSVPSQSR
ncbi:MAG: Brp/Blh family beta-carotene 15,15'-dioxygenase [Acidobacteriota bacterium]